MTKKSETKCRIIRAAREEFKTKGYENASVRDIAQKAGYTTGVLYGRYKDKEELYSSVVKLGEMAMEDKIAEIYKLDSLQDRDFSVFLSSGRNDGGESLSFVNNPVISTNVERSQSHSFVSRNEVVNRLLSIIDTVYTYKDTFELLIRCSKGSSKENYIEDFADREGILKAYIFDNLTSNGVSDNIMLSSLSRNLAVAVYCTLFNFALDLPKEDVVKFIESSLAD